MATRSRRAHSRLSGPYNWPQPTDRIGIASIGNPEVNPALVTTALQAHLEIRRGRAPVSDARLVGDGKFLRAGDDRFLIKGVTYGTFAPDAAGCQYPGPQQVAEDFRLMAELGINTVRTYTVPRMDLLDEAARQGLRVMVGLPWSQHVAFLDDRRLKQEIRQETVARVRELGRHPAVALFALGNEIPPGVVRWHGRLRVERFLRGLYEESKAAVPDALLTYVNFPPTEFLDLSFFDLYAFNVYLHREAELRAYLTRLQHIAGHKPLLLAEAGADSIREGDTGQAEITAMHVRVAFEEGACGAIAFAWTDEWWRGGTDVEDWKFGLVDRQRRLKPAARRNLRGGDAKVGVQVDLHVVPVLRALILDRQQITLESKRLPGRRRASGRADRRERHRRDGADLQSDCQSDLDPVFNLKSSIICNLKCSRRSPPIIVQ